MIESIVSAKTWRVSQKGYGAALLGGIAAARGKYIVMGDSDCSYDFGDIPRFLDKLEEGYDLVMGNRFAGGIKPGAMPWHHRYIGNPILSGIGRLLYWTSCRDWHCGLRAFSYEKIQGLKLNCSGMEFASEMVILACKHRLQVAEIPTTLAPDGRARPPHLRCFSDGLRHLLVMSKNSYVTKFCGLLISVMLCTLCASWFFRSNTAQTGLEYRGGTFVVPLSLGTRFCGEVFEREFQISNTSKVVISNDLRFEGCSCLRYRFTPSTIHPGESGRVFVKYAVGAGEGSYTTVSGQHLSDSSFFGFRAFRRAKSLTTDVPLDGRRVLIEESPIVLCQLSPNTKIDFSESLIPEWIDIEELSEGGKKQLRLSRKGFPPMKSDFAIVLAFKHNKEDTAEKVRFTVVVR